MTALGNRLAEIREEGRAALIGYLPAGFPSAEGSLRAIAGLVEAGVDVVEVGIPYSDPVLDGPVIQRASARALDAGTRITDAFRAVAAAVDAGAPAVVMTYYNPMLQYGLSRFADDLKAAGGSGVITPDLTPDSAEEWMAAAAARDLDHIFLVAPSSTPERLAMTAAASTGFLYAASLMGVTGERGAVGAAAESLVSRARGAGATTVCVGLGVSTGAQATQVAAYADGVIVGSALVRPLLDAADEDAGIAAMKAKVAELAAGVRGRA